MINNKRTVVIERSILIERFISAALSAVLGIDLEDSKMLGNKAGGLSFFQKLSLLEEMEITAKKDKEKIRKFSEIRNQFAHNFDVKNFSSCFSFLDGTESYLRKTYKPNFSETSLSQEEQLSILYECLFDDVLKCAESILLNIQERFVEIGREKFQFAFYKDFFEEIKAFTNDNPALEQEFKTIASKIIERYNSNRV